LHFWPEFFFDDAVNVSAMAAANPAAPDASRVRRWLLPRERVIVSKASVVMHVSPCVGREDTLH